MNVRSIVGVMVCLAMLVGCQRTAQRAQPVDDNDPAFHSELMDEYLRDRADEPQFIQGDRPILGRVVAVVSEQAKVDIGEMQSRFVPLKIASEKHFDVRPGDHLVLVVNDQNLVVDYHPVDQPAVGHRIVRGALAQNLPVGQEQAVIRTEAGEEENLEIRDAARSKIASIPVGEDLIFLIDETDKIVDATIANQHALSQARQQPEQKSPIKGAHRRVDGVIVKPLSLDRITIRTDDLREESFDVRPFVQEKLAGMKQGEAITVMVDTEEKVIDVATLPR